MRPFIRSCWARHVRKERVRIQPTHTHSLSHTHSRCRICQEGLRQPGSGHFATGGFLLNFPTLRRQSSAQVEMDERRAGSSSHALRTRRHIGWAPRPCHHHPQKSARNTKVDRGRAERECLGRPSGQQAALRQPHAASSHTRRDERRIDVRIRPRFDNVFKAALHLIHPAESEAASDPASFSASTRNSWSCTLSLPLSPLARQASSLRSSRGVSSHHINARYASEKYLDPCITECGITSGGMLRIARACGRQKSAGDL